MKQVGFDSAVLTKLDSDTRAGAAFAFRYALKKPIVFVGSGEKITDLERFILSGWPDVFLGWGILPALVERANEKIKQSEQECAGKIICQGADDPPRFCRSDENDAKARISFPDCKIYAGSRQPCTFPGNDPKGRG